MEAIEPKTGREPIRLVLITGMSGAGKSTALKALEDVGFFCIDNLPVVLLPKLVELFPSSRDEIEQVGLVIDAREGRFLELVEENLEQVRRHGSRVEVLFLDCNDAELVRRYTETRRSHPLAPRKRPEEGVAIERRVIEKLRQQADEVIDTSAMTPHALRQVIQQRYLKPQEGRMLLWLLSFGYKHGLPGGVHLLFDARFLRNPYFDPELRQLTGLEERVRDYVMADPRSGEFLDRIADFVRTFRPAYDQEGKSHLVCAVGCTGGRHRSVVIVEELAKLIDGPLKVHHRDLQQPP
ncbi:MAG: RNase adapter RapZ [Deltaproteobacteria bacterium]|nr:MAG: RNase adapter RapZ [Deltaproteobacteria bacterium]